MHKLIPSAAALALIAISAQAQSQIADTETAGAAPVAPVVAPVAPVAPVATAGAPLTMQQAVDKALAQRPGEVIGTDRERKRGRDAWEVEIRDADGQKWELYYAVDDGTLLYEDRD
jgi:uncharacterized membrane protein YkoI